MAEAKFLVFQNQTGSNIFLLIKAKENGPIEFVVYSKRPVSYPGGAMLCELEPESGARIENKAYANYSVINRSGRSLSLSEEKSGETVNIILEAVQH